MSSPIPYTTDIERIDQDEADINAELADTFRQIIETTYRDLGHGFRGVHAKSHALLHARVRVLEGLPPHYAQGVFAEPKSFDALVRISTGAGDILPDSVSLIRGFAIKLVGVEGERLTGSEGDTTQDFLFANGVAFPTPGPKKFLANLKLLAKTTDKVEGLKKAVSAVFRTAEKGVEAVGGESALLEQLGGHRHTHPLGESFFTQAPIRYGDYIAKLGVVPLSENFKALEGQEIDIAGRDDALREEIATLLAARVLKAVNAPFYGLPQPVNSIAQAVTYLGLTTVRITCLRYIFIAAFKAGLVPFNTNYRYGGDELTYLFDNADAEAMEARESEILATLGEPDPYGRSRRARTT